MRRLLLIVGCIAAWTCIAAAPAWAWSAPWGNFHVKGGVPVACHWEYFGGPSPAQARNALIQCENSRRHTFVEINRRGELIVKGHYRGRIARGSTTWYPTWLSPHLSCVTLSVPMLVGGGRDYELTCTFFSRTGQPARAFSVGDIWPLRVTRY